METFSRTQEQLDSPYSIQIIDDNGTVKNIVRGTLPEVMQEITAAVQRRDCLIVRSKHGDMMIQVYSPLFTL